MEFAWWAGRTLEDEAGVNDIISDLVESESFPSSAGFEDELLDSLFVAERLKLIAFRRDGIPHSWLL